jgi:hypothetical protein
MSEQAFELIKAVGGTGAILLVVLYGLYLLLQPLLKNHLELITEVRNDMKTDRLEFNQHRLESQRVQLEMLQAIRDLREAIKGESNV